MTCVLSMELYVYYIELPETDSTVLRVVNLTFYLIDNLTIILFIVEIILKWIDDFKNYWRNMWNIFELIVALVVRI